MHGENILTVNTARMLTMMEDLKSIETWIMQEGLHELKFSLPLSLSAIHRADR